MSPTTHSPTVAVIGGGASGTLATIHAVRAWPDARHLRIVMYDARGRPGRGIAYGTGDHSHLLNVPAGRMSALADQPSHFLDWLCARYPDATSWTFAPRVTYGEYLEESLFEHGRRVDFVVRDGSVTDVVRAARGFQLRSGHAAERVDAVVLATGNLPPTPLVIRGVEIPPGPHYVADPWAPDALRVVGERAGRNGTVLLVGSGLTSVDVALTLTDTNPGVHMVCISRHGLLPRRHVTPFAEPWPVRVPDQDTALTLQEVAALVSAQVDAARSAGSDWRTVVDGLRPHVSTLWQRLPIAERRRFIAGPSRLWDVHRHRMAPAVGAVIGELLGRGRLEVRAAGLLDMRPTSKGYAVTLATGTTTERLDVAVVVNCTGPAVASVHGADQLLTRLVARGLAQYDALGLGVETDLDGRLVDGHGSSQPDLFALGPLRRGELWESTAVPEIRQQAAQVASCLRDYLAAPAAVPGRAGPAGVAD
ncbi:MAG: FAD/NAD(P)-binding protein [Actinomycetes bacterium]